MREQGELELLENQGKWQTLFNSLDDFLIVLDLAGCILQVNLIVLRRLGYAEEELLGKPVSMVHPPDLQEEATTVVADMIAGKLDRGHIPLMTKAGEWIPVETKITQGNWGGQPALFGVSRDMTERKQAEELLRMQRELGVALLAAPKLAETLEICLDTALRASGMEGGGIYLVDESSGIDLVCHRGLLPDFVKAVQHYDYDLSSPNVQMVLAGKPVYLGYEQLDRSTQAALTRPMNSVAVIPIHFEDRVIACFNMASYTHHQIPAMARNVLEAIAAQIGTAIRRSKVEEALRKSEEKLRSTLDSISDLVFVLDRNGVFEEFYSSIDHPALFVPPEHFLGKHFKEVLPSHVEQLLKEAIQRFEASPKSQQFDYPLVVNNTEMWFSARGAMRRGREGEFVGTTLVVRNITEQKQAEAALRESEARLAFAVEASEGAYYVQTADLSQLVIDERWARSLGYTLNDLPASGSERAELWQKNVHPDDRARAEQLFADFIANKTEKYHAEFRIRHKDGSWRWMNSKATAIERAEQGQVVRLAGMFFDITEQKEAAEALQQAHDELETRVKARTKELQESEAKWRSLVENVPDTIFTIDAGGTILSLNRPILERPVAEVLDTSVFDFILPENFAEIKGLVARVFETGQLESGETVALGPNNTPLWFSFRIGPVFSGAEVIAATVIASDITARKQTELQIKASLEEKEALLKEIHHRVKNNLQVVASMLNMQTRYTDDEQVIGQLLESRNRIYSMALVHENLYRSETLAQVDSVAYISDLVNNILQSYDLEAGKIELKLAVEPILLTIDQAVPCGLILNELVTNALKHAFPKTGAKQGAEKGKISITLHQNKDAILLLKVVDNGVGLPEDLDLDLNKTLGLRLVKTLVRQLDATLDVDRDSGATFKVTFSKADE